MIFDGKRQKLRSLWTFRDLRLSTKLIVTYLLLTVIPMSMLGFLSYQQYTRSIEEQNGEYLPKLLQHATVNMDSYMNELARLPEQLSSSDTVMSILRREAYQSQADRNKDQFTVNSYLSRTYLEGGSTDVLGVFIWSKNRWFQSSRMAYSGLDEEHAQAVFGQDLEIRDQAKIMLPGELGLTFDNHEPYILMMKQLNDTDNQKIVGTMLIAVRLTFMEHILEHLEPSTHSILRLQSPEGLIIYDADPTKIGGMDREIASYPIKAGSFIRRLGGEASLVSISESSSYGWLLTYSVPLRELTVKTDWIRNVTIALFIGFAAVTTVISIVFAMNVTRPLKMLSGLMREAEQGRFRHADEQALSGAEVGMLAHSFNSLLNTIDGLIDKTVKIETNQKEAELYALQSQINPHFMYNTLESIGMAVEEGMQDSAVDMLTLLGRMLRFSIGNQSKFVTVADELRHVRDYLTIQQFRFEERLKFSILEELEQLEQNKYYTPKFILQPIVENAIKHGLEMRKRLEVKLVIRSVETGDGALLEFIVSDNGPGIPEGKLKELKEQMDEDGLKKADSGFGLTNVYSRIKLMLGSAYGLNIESVPGEGTDVWLRLPLLLEPQGLEHRTGETEQHEQNKRIDRG